MKPHLILVAALARNDVIGTHNQIPWHLPDDLKRFKALTLGHAVIMGRKTWESLPEKFRPLPGRRNIVISRNAHWCADGALSANTLEAAIALAGDQTAFVIGGAEIYALALPYADGLELTEIDADFVGDAWFPSWDKLAWREIARQTFHAAAGFDYSFVSYRKVGFSNNASTPP